MPSANRRADRPEAADDEPDEEPGEQQHPERGRGRREEPGGRQQDHPDGQHQPAVPAETPNPVAIGVRRPIGRISVVTMAKIPTVTAKTAAHRGAGPFMGPQ